MWVNTNSLAKSKRLMSPSSSRLTYTVQISNAARQEKFLGMEWPNMEMAVSFHFSTSFFVGGHPTNIDDYFRRFCLSIGYSTSNTVVIRRNVNTGASKSGQRFLGDPTPVTGIFKDLFCNTRRAARFEMTADDVQNILENVKGVDVKDSTSQTAASSIPMQDTTIAQTSKLLKQWKNQQRVAPLQLLSSLRNAIQQETVEPAFDRFLLHRTCWRHLRSFKETRHEDYWDSTARGIWRQKTSCHMWWGISS